MPLRDDLLNPIPGATPSGENLRYAPVYDQIKEARREEAEVAQGDWQIQIKKADWVQVVKLSSEALANKTKDLQIAVWLAEALTHREGFTGLKAGLDLVRALIENFWDTLYPELEDGDAGMRAAPVDWIGSRMDDTVRRVPLTRSGRDWFAYKESRAVPYEADAAVNESRQQARAVALEDGKLAPEVFDEEFNTTPKAFYQQAATDVAGCLESLESLQAACEVKFGDDSPTLSGLKQTLAEVQQTLRILLAKKREREPDEGEAGESEAVEEEAAESVSGEGGAAAAPARALAKAGRKFAGGEPADREDAAERVAAVAQWLRAQDASHPAPYLMVRALRWGELRAAGEGYDPDYALLEPPPTATRQELRRLANEGEWGQALEVAERAAAAPCGRGWLDVHRYAAQACENLGYAAAAWAIKSAVKGLLADLPKLVEMSLSDDTPTANAETQAWLKTLAGLGAGPAVLDYFAPTPAATGEESGEELGQALPDPFQMALEAARTGRTEEAIEILSREAAQEPSGRGRFQRKVQLAQVCLGAGREAIARPILEDVLEEIERRKLEEWEPADSLAHALALLYRSMDRLGATAEEKQQIYGRICRLDPVQALAISG